MTNDRREFMATAAGVLAAVLSERLDAEGAESANRRHNPAANPSRAVATKDAPAGQP